MVVSGDMVADGHRGRRAVDGTVEVLHESERTVVTRVALPGGDTVIRKQVRGPDCEQRVRRERAMLLRLAGLEYAPRLAGDAVTGDALLLVDVGGVSLGSVLSAGAIGLVELFTLAVDLAEVVAAVHGRGVVHKDINPGNILLSGVPHRPSLIDFGLAMTFAEERPAFVPADLIEGTLVYLAPEQTGRTGRPVDHRADLYALGATLYEAATGVPPFGTDDPLRLIHDHLVRTPDRPDQVNPALPAGLSDLILRLLEKEPDRRYQSAAGLAYDLVRMRDELANGEQPDFPLGERDFPLRLTAPSRLVGRDAEITTLREAFADAMTGHCHGVLVSGVPGVGKSSLIDELRPIVAISEGWFVSGKFDQYREDLESDGVRQSLRRLCQLLLAEPDSEMPVLRVRLCAALGSNTGLMAAMLPEFALLVGLGDGGAAPSEVRVNRDQLVQMGLDFLYAVATPDRPVVMMLDDLQWAGAGPIALVDAVLNEPERSGLLLVCAYRDAEVDAAHPLTAMLARWRQPGSAPRQIRLHNLSVAGLGALFAEMLRLAPPRAAELAEVVAVRTGGNPYDSLELLNALRREGTLMPGADGWQWDPMAVRRHLGRADVVELLIARIDALPAETGALLEMVACLGGEVAPDLLGAASDRPGAVLAEQLLPALEDGLLVMEQAGGTVRFRHDRVQQAAFTRLSPQARAELQLTLARRLAGEAGFRAVAAEQYLPAVDLISDREEHRRVAGLFHETAAGLRILQPAAAERLLSAAVSLLGTDPAGVDVRLLAGVQGERQAALFALGRLEDADEVYQSIEQLCPDLPERVAATCVQIASLINRNRAAEALALGLGLLARLGLPAPAADEIGAAIGRGLATLTAWAAADDKDDDLRRPQISDPRLLATSVLMNKLAPAAFLENPAIMAWLLVEAQRMWASHGPCEPLVTILGTAGFVTASTQQDYRTGYAVGRHLIAVSEAHGFESGAASAKSMCTANAAHWYEPLEDVIRDARQAREDLLRTGDLRNASYTYNVTTSAILDCGPALGTLLAEVESGLALCHRTGNQQVTEFLVPVRQLVQALRGETDATFTEATHPAGPIADALAQAMFHISRAVTAAIKRDLPQLTEHAAAATALIPMLPGTYFTAVVQLLQSLALAQRVAVTVPDERAAPLAELDANRAWFAARTVDAPPNFAHLSTFLDAERAWAVGDTWAAICAFDAALHEPHSHQRPWHRALIAERAALFHLAHGLQHPGRALLAVARDGYAAWGAVTKTRDLDEQYPWLAAISADRPQPQGTHTIETRRSGSISSEAIDLLGVLNASQALSSETNLDRIRARVSDVLSAMTGATAVQVLLRDDQSNRWYLADPTGEPGATIPLEKGAARGLLPISVIRYTERTRQPLLVDDAAHDDRFSRDPYLTGVTCCSLMVVPILAQGIPRAILLLENRLTRGAFNADRLDAVHLVAGQLAVSIDNALLYASLERKVAERTEALAHANERLAQLATIDTLTGLPNRRRLDDILDAEWQRALRPKTPLAVAMIDIDQFKLYNDHYGHPAGDRCLHQVATALAGNLRNTDHIARYGGEEFCLVMPDTDISGAVIAAERVRIAVEELAEPHTVATHGTVTISVGVASAVPTPHDTVQDLIRHADDHLYQAKRAGRNRTASEAGN
jgi:diguanylate cyclase (GGDEF)-like protein